MRTFLTALSFATTLFACRATQAQPYHYSTVWYPPPVTVSTVEVAYYPVDRSYAVVLAEQAQVLRLENESRLMARATQLDRMRIEYHDLAHRMEADRRETTSTHWKKSLLELARAYRLSSREFNPVTGTINWPMLAESPRYEEHRQLIQQIMWRIVVFRLWDDRLHMDELSRACQDFVDQLRRDAAEFKAEQGEDFLAVEKFLLGVKYSPYLIGLAPENVNRVAAQSGLPTQPKEDSYL